MERKVVSGIQQLGIGVMNVIEAWKWYKEYFGFDIRVFDDTAVAGLMLPYTGGQPHKRQAVLAMNMQGGGGFEIWQYKERTPQAPQFQIQLGDLGIFVAKIKSRNVKSTFEYFTSQKLNIISSLVTDPNGNETFYIKDPYNNIFQIVSSNSWFKLEKKHMGAVAGATIGVTNIERSIKFYNTILGFDEVVYDKTGTFDDIKTLPGGVHTFRRVLLRHKKPRRGAFSPLFGSAEIELVQVIDRTPEKIFKGRFWGDLGYIHLCFDIRGMDLLRQECIKENCPFTVDSKNDFDMGEAAGIFSYVEDPDGTLIEFVEALKVPVIKKLGVYLHLKNRNPEKSLPSWMIHAMAFNRVKHIQ